METRITSKFLERCINPPIYKFRDHIGQEIIVGLKGKDQFGNDTVGYVTGIVGYGEGSEVGLYELVEWKTGRGLANRIILLNTHTPIAEAFLPATVQERRADLSRKEKTDLTYKVEAEPNNPNSSVINTYTFKSE